MAAYSQLYQAIERGALESVVGWLTGGGTDVARLVERMAQPPIGANLTYDEARYLAQIGSRAYISSVRLIEGRNVWEQDIPILNQACFENIEGGAGGKYNYRFLLRNVGEEGKGGIPVSFSSDDKLNIEQVMEKIGDFLTESLEPKYRERMEKTLSQDFELLPVFMFKANC